MKRYRITIENQTFDVELLDDPRQEEVRVRVDQETFTVLVEPGDEGELPAVSAPTRDRSAASVTAPAASAPVQPAAAGSNTVKSPLPGVVKSIAVKKGQTVAFNDELCVIEAMKAMNVIRAPRAGTIGDIHVSIGSQIPYGAPLLDLS
jgi:biotin carboxyl carrier protein